MSLPEPIKNARRVLNAWLPQRVVAGLSDLKRWLADDRLYYAPRKTQRDARRAGLSVHRYVEKLSGSVGDTERIFEELSRVGVLGRHRRICEVGAGAGRYLDGLISRCGPDTYEVYEISRGWARYLEKTYAPVVRARPVDGETLAATESSSCGLSCAFGVFIYIAPLKTLSYLREMTRVTQPGGYIVFDYYPAEAVSIDEVFDRWLPSKHRFAQWLPGHVVTETLARGGCEVVHQRRLEFVWSRPTLVVARKVRQG